MISTGAGDLRYAARTLARDPWFTFSVVLTLAIGIGANTAVFAVVNAVVFRPLPFSTPDRLVAVREHREQPGFEQTVIARGEFLRWSRAARTIVDATAVIHPGLEMRIGDHAERVAGLSVTPGFFPLLGVAAQRGRVFTAKDATAGAAAVVLISDRLWRDRFQGDPALVGRTLIVDGEPRAVIGVLPRGFRFTERTDAIVPLVLRPADESIYDDHYLEVYARLADGATIEQAQTELTAIASANQGPTRHLAGAAVVPLHEMIAGPLTTPMIVLLASVLLVLLIASANIANLQLSRAEWRRHEMAVRAALGASRWRVVRQVITENVVLAAVGGGAGVLVAAWAIDALVAVSPIDTPGLADVRLDARVLVFAVGATLGAALLFGTAPAWVLSRREPSETLRHTARVGAGGRRRALAWFVASEVSLAVMLLVGAGLLIATFANLRAVSPGFDPTNVATVSIGLPATRYHDAPARGRAADRLVAAARTLPGVSAAAAVNVLPLSGDNVSSTITIEGTAFVDGPNRPNANWRKVTAEYFEALRIPLLRGRFLSDTDTADTPNVAVVNQTMADRFWPGQDPIGRRYKRGRPQGAGRWITVVGVVGDVRHSTLREPPRPEMYVPFAQAPEDFFVLVVRSSQPAGRLRAPLQAAVQRIDPDIPVAGIRSFTDIVGESLALSRFETLTMGAFAIVALLLAAGGIYAVTSYSVSRRTREFGIRLALGAEWSALARLVLGEAAATAGAGLAVGAAAALVLARSLRSLLFGVTPLDPAVFLITIVGLGSVLVVASLMPARRAASIDPTVALRLE